MSRKARKVPSYCHHKASGNAYVRIYGSDHYLGQYGSPESHEKYEQLIAEWRVKQQERSAAKVANLQPTVANTITINEMILRYILFAVTYYVNRHGEQTKELQEMKYALKPLKKLYGRTLVRDFGPLALKAIQQHMVGQKHSVERSLTAGSIVSVVFSNGQ